MRTSRRDVHVSFEDSLKGAQTQIPVEVDTPCSECHGSGAKPGTSPRICPECNGRGVVSESQGLFALSQPCPRCRGNGTVSRTRARSATAPGASGARSATPSRSRPASRTARASASRARARPGYGGAPAGDLFVVTHVEPSDTYERRGNDLLVTVPVSFPDAALGTTVQVPTPDGAVSLKVPAGSEDGKLLRIRGRGAPKLSGGGKGDVLARLKLEVPKRLNKKQRQLLEEFRNVS